MKAKKNADIIRYMRTSLGFFFFCNMQMSKNPKNCQHFLNELVKKVTKNQGYILSSENTILEKPQEGGGNGRRLIRVHSTSLKFSTS